MTLAVMTFTYFLSSDRMKQVTDMLSGLYKFYHYSPKAWRELKAIAALFEDRVFKPTNLGGTRWLPHISRALSTILKNYGPLLAHMENSVETRSGSAEMQGRARQVQRMLSDYRNLLFIHLVMDILDLLSRLLRLYHLSYCHVLHLKKETLDSIYPCSNLVSI